MGPNQDLSEDLKVLKFLGTLSGGLPGSKQSSAAAQLGRDHCDGLQLICGG